VLALFRIPALLAKLAQCARPFCEFASVACCVFRGLPVGQLAGPCASLGIASPWNENVSVFCFLAQAMVMKMLGEQQPVAAM